MSFDLKPRDDEPMEQCEFELYGERCQLNRGHAGLHDRDIQLSKVREVICGTAKNVRISTSEDSTANRASNSDFLMSDEEWNGLKKETQEKVRKWFDLAVECLEGILNETNQQQNSATGTDIVHGATCRKVPHSRSGYLHGEDDDTPYMVDGLKYCGRCHTSL